MSFWMSRTDAAKARVPRATAIEPPWVGRVLQGSMKITELSRTKPSLRPHKKCD